MLFHTLFSLCVVVNVLGCLWWNIALGEGLQNSWAASLSEWAVRWAPGRLTVGRDGLHDVRLLPLRQCST